MLNPFIDLIGSAIHIYTTLLLVWVVMSLLIQFNIIKPRNQMLKQIFSGLSQIIEPALMPIRRRMWRWFPRLQAVDISPIILILLLNFANNALYSWLYNI